MVSDLWNLIVEVDAFCSLLQYLNLQIMQLKLQFMFFFANIISIWRSGNKKKEMYAYIFQG